MNDMIFFKIALSFAVGAAFLFGLTHGFNKEKIQSWKESLEDMFKRN